MWQHIPRKMPEEGGYVTAAGLAGALEGWARSLSMLAAAGRRLRPDPGHSIPTFTTLVDDLRMIDWLTSSKDPKQRYLQHKWRGAPVMPTEGPAAALTAGDWIRGVAQAAGNDPRAEQSG